MAEITKFYGEILDSESFNYYIDLSIIENRQMLLDRFIKRRGGRDDAFRTTGALPVVSTSPPQERKQTQQIASQDKPVNSMLYRRV